MPAPARRTRGPHTIRASADTLAAAAATRVPLHRTLRAMQPVVSGTAPPPTPLPAPAPPLAPEPAHAAAVAASASIARAAPPLAPQALPLQTRAADAQALLGGPRAGDAAPAPWPPAGAAASAGDGAGRALMLQLSGRAPLGATGADPAYAPAPPDLLRATPALPWPPARLGEGAAPAGAAAAATPSLFFSSGLPAYAGAHGAPHLNFMALNAHGMHYLPSGATAGPAVARAIDGYVPFASRADGAIPGGSQPAAAAAWPMSALDPHQQRLLAQFGSFFPQLSMPELGLFAAQQPRPAAPVVSAPPTAAAAPPAAGSGAAEAQRRALAPNAAARALVGAAGGGSGAAQAGSEKRHACPQCEKLFRVRASLTVHMRTHTGARPFKCTECSATFADSSNRRRHLLTHRPGKSFTCDKCSYATTRRYRFQRHLVSAHGAETAQPELQHEESAPSS